jgi:two-component system, chemotaxis family, sensor kinase CheA
MSEYSKSTVLAAELQLELDELATSLLLNGASDELMTGLRQLSERAGKAGIGRIPQIVSTLAPAANSPAATVPTAVVKDEQLRNALAQIQQCLASAPSQPAPELQKATAVNPLAQDAELVGDFILESREHLASIEKHMLTLERNPEDKEAVHAVFRGFHTIKGLAGFLEFMPVRDVAHEVETLLDLARNGKLSITGSVVDVVLESVDYLKQTIAVIEASLAGAASEPLSENQALLERIQALISGKPKPIGEESLAPVLSNLSQSLSAPVPAPSAAVEATPEPVAQDAPKAAHSAGRGPDAAKESRIPEEPSGESVVRASSVEQAANKTKKEDSAAAVIRVQTAKLDYLMDMVGEMVITQSLIRHNPAFAALQSSKLLGDLSQLARITSEVQRTTMAMRMMMVGTVFQRSSRLVRDLSRKAGKRVQLEISGEETEVDKTIAEELTDPLLHMVRNACDHGIETPEERVAAGKPATARIRLAAYHQGGQIVIETSDDGRGLDREKIFNKAVQKGLVEANAHFSEQEIFNLIFEPGFSTAAQITDLSGRGVGMDVVRRNIQKLRGRIEIQSKTGQGTTFFLKLPLTLAIIEGLVVGVGVHRYIVPIFAVRELISPKPDTLSTVHGRNEMALVRDRVVPVLRLSKRFGVKPKSDDPTKSLLIVTECQEQQFCLLVDEVLGKQEVVIKSLGETLKNIPGIAGGAILGDGRVGLILDLEGVFRGNKQ